MHGKIVCKDIEIKYLGEYHDLYPKNDALLLAGVFEKFREISLQIYELDSATFIEAPRLAWQAALKKTKLELDLLTDIDYILMVEKSIRGGICDAIHRYAKVNNKYIKDYDENKESSYLNHQDVNNLYGCAISQIFQHLILNGTKKLLNLKKKDTFLKLMFNIQKNYMNFIVNYHFCLKEKNLKSRKACK